MNDTKPKTLEELPQFTVISVRHIEPSNAEYQLYEIKGRFPESLESSFELIMERDVCQWFWLLYGHRECLTPTLESFDKEAKIAVLSCLEKEEPKIAGLELTYLSSYWQAYHIWMVLDSDWSWERKQFLGSNAVAEDYEANTVSIVDGREIRVWTKLESLGPNSGQSRHYPAADQTLPVRPGTRLVPAAWGHEHCDLCNKHIDAGGFGYCDRGLHWICESCYQRYVLPHDLSFIDEL